MGARIADVQLMMMYDDRQNWSHGEPHLNDAFADESGAEELEEGHAEVAADDAAQIEECVGPGSQQQHPHEAKPAAQSVRPMLLHTSFRYTAI